MKNLLRYLPLKLYVPFCILVCSSLGMQAQYKKISLTGFNYDVIADSVLNATPDTLTNYTLDGTNVLFASGYSNNSIPDDGGLPGNLTLLSNAGHYFQLQPYNANNALEVDFFNNFTGTLTFGAADQVTYDSLFLLATSANGPSNITWQINFTDESTTTGSFVVPDWYCNGCSNYAVNNLSRVMQSDGSVNQAGMFALYELAIPLSPSDRLKQIYSIDLSAPTDDSPSAYFFAISGYSSFTLPVSLQYFNASIKNGNALLQWKTGDEQNNRQFIIERASAAAPNNFTQVGIVKSTQAAGGSAYSFTNAPGLSGTYLYRISQQDADGHKKVLGIRSLTFNGDVHWVVQDLGYQWKLITSSAYHYRLLNMQGQVISAASGSGSVSINKPAARGIYFIQVAENGQWSTQKLLH